MKKLIFAFLMLAVFSSCEDEDHDVDVNNFNGSENVTYFTDGSASTYFVTQNSEPVSIQIGATNISSSARTYSVQADPASTSQEGVDFSFVSNTVTIPAGEYFGNILIQGIFEGTTPAGSNLVLNITGDNVMVDTKYTLNIVQSCPLEAPFTGDYLIQELTPYVDGPTLQDGDVITVYETSEFGRAFMTAYYVFYCSTPAEFLFELKCGLVRIPAPGNLSNCSCGGNLYFTDATTPSTYDTQDDSYFELTFTNDAYSDCGPPAQTTYSFTKQ